MMSNFIVLSVFINGKSTVACIVLSTAALHLTPKSDNAKI